MILQTNKMKLGPNLFPKLKEGIIAPAARPMVLYITAKHRPETHALLCIDTEKIKEFYSGNLEEGQFHKMGPHFGSIEKV